jgi:hypothetical protein
MPIITIRGMKCLIDLYFTAVAVQKEMKPPLHEITIFMLKSNGKKKHFY